MSVRALYTFVGYYFTLLMFGVFGLSLSLFAWVAGAFPDGRRTERFFQRLIHWNFALFVGWTTFARLFEVSYHGLERLPRDPGRGLVVIANHPGLTDITCLLARLPAAICIFKQAIRHNPVLGAAARRAGYVANDGGHEVIRASADKVASARTLVIFPEGTRTPPGVPLLPFRPGYLLIARRSGVPVQLVRIVNSRPVLAKGRAWWKFPPLPARAEITFGPQVPVPEEADIHALNSRIEAWFRSPIQDIPGNVACANGSATLCSPARPTAA